MKSIQTNTDAVKENAYKLYNAKCMLYIPVYMLKEKHTNKNKTFKQKVVQKMLMKTNEMHNLLREP